MSTSIQSNICNLFWRTILLLLTMVLVLRDGRYAISHIMRFSWYQVHEITPFLVEFPELPQYRRRYQNKGVLLKVFLSSKNKVPCNFLCQWPSLKLRWLGFICTDTLLASYMIQQIAHFFIWIYIPLLLTKFTKTAMYIIFSVDILWIVESCFLQSLQICCKSVVMVLFFSFLMETIIYEKNRDLKCICTTCPKWGEQPPSMLPLHNYSIWSGCLLLVCC